MTYGKEELRCIQDGKRIFNEGEYGAYVMMELKKQREYLVDKLMNCADWPDYCTLRGKIETMDKVLGILDLTDDIYFS